MTVVTRGEQVYFVVLFLSAVWIGLVGLFLPAQLAAIFTWFSLPPLHARFLGAIYLFGTLFMLGSLFARRGSQVQVALVTAAIWTGLIFIVSVLNIGAFDLGTFSSWGWLGSYFVYALAAIWLAWARSRRTPPAATSEPLLSGWLRGFLLAQGGLMIVLGLALLVAPGLVALVWPWKVTAQLAQFYSGPLLGYGYSSVQFARSGAPTDLRTVLPGMLVFTVSVAVVSLLHSSLFSLGDVSVWLWFAGFILATAFLGAASLSTLQSAGTKSR